MNDYFPRDRSLNIHHFCCGVDCDRPPQAWRPDEGQWAVLKVIRLMGVGVFLERDRGSCATALTHPGGSASRFHPLRRWM
jgi:hypothetical protein